MTNCRLHGIKCSNFFSSLNLDFMIKVKTGESKLQSKTKNLLCILFLSFDRPDVFCFVKPIWQSFCSVDPSGPRDRQCQLLSCPGQIRKNISSCHITLRYESSTLILCKELISPFFQSCLSGIRDTLPDLHFVQYIKA